MSRKTLSTFLTQLGDDPALQSKLSDLLKDRSAADASAAIIAVTQEAGYSISEADLTELMETMAETDKLSDGALDNIAGGMVGRHAIFEIYAGSPDYNPKWWRDLKGR